MSKNLVILSGDSGAFNSLPRYTCFKFKNITYITHGIGNLKNDVAIIISNGELFTIGLD